VPMHLGGLRLGCAEEQTLLEAIAEMRRWRHYA
jgi:hypothetical protein